MWQHVRIVRLSLRQRDCAGGEGKNAKQGFEKVVAGVEIRGACGASASRKGRRNQEFGGETRFNTHRQLISRASGVLNLPLHGGRTVCVRAAERTKCAEAFLAGTTMNLIARICCLATASLLVLGSERLEAEEPTLLGRTVLEWSADLRSDDQLKRVKAAWALAQLGKPAFELLKDASAQKDPSVQVWAVRGLGFALVGESPKTMRGVAGEATLESRLEDASPSVRLAAAEALADRGDKRGLVALEKLLEHPNDQIRHHTLLALDKPMQLDDAMLDKIDKLRDDSYDYAKRVAERITRRQRKEK